MEKTKFLKDLENYDENIHEQLLFFYDCYIGKNNCEVFQVKEFLKEIFRSNYSREILIPIDFISSFVGKILFTLMFSLDEKEYTTNDLVNITGFSIKHILDELKGYKEGTNYIYKESDVKIYLDRKNINFNLNTINKKHKKTILIKKELFVKDLKNYDENIHEQLLFFYDCYIGKNNCEVFQVKEFLNDLFKNNYSKEILIPIDFILNSYIGEVLFNIIFSTVEKEYTTKDLTTITGFSKAYIHQERKDGNLIGYKDGRNYKYKKSDVEKYLKRKKIKFN